MPEEADTCVHCGKILRNPPNCCYTAITDYEDFAPKEEKEDDDFQSVLYR